MWFVAGILFISLVNIAIGYRFGRWYWNHCGVIMPGVGDVECVEADAVAGTQATESSVETQHEPVSAPTDSDPMDTNSTVCGYLEKRNCATPPKY